MSSKHIDLGEVLGSAPDCQCPAAWTHPVSVCPSLLALILQNGIVKPGLEWVNDDSSKTLQAFFLWIFWGSRTGPASNLFITSIPSRTTNSVVWAKIKNYFQDPGVHPKNTHSLLFYNQRVQQLWQEAMRRKAVTQVSQSLAVSGWTSQKQYLTM